MTPTRFTYPSPSFEHFWKDGNGKPMLKKLNVIPSEEEIKSSCSLYFEVDELADRVIVDLYFKLGFQEANLLIEKTVESGIQETTPISLKQLILEMESIPAWLDWEKIELAAQFSSRTSAHGLIVLRNYSLMGGYESSAINKALVATGALHKGATKRINETTEFWVDIMGPNALKRENSGFKACLNTRLMHAFARQSILKSTTWSNNDWGLPLNQWDMLATNLGFSLVFMNGLELLSYQISQKEKEAVFHFWKYIGHLIGINTEIIPENEEEAIRALYRWTMNQPAADEDSKKLALALYKEPLTATYIKFKWQRKLVLKFHLAYNHFFLGKVSCSNMSLPESKLNFYPKLIRFKTRISERVVHSNWYLMKLSINRGRKNQQKIKRFIVQDAMNKQKKG